MNPRPRNALILSGLLALSLTACPGTPTGSLTVNVTTPAGVTANVQVSGPNGYSTTVSASTTISQLAS